MPNSILVVEDSPTCAVDLVAILGRSGYIVDVAKTFDEMWQRLGEQTYSMILLDYLVEDDTATAHIPRVSALAPVVIVSANATAALVSQAMREGACGAVDKKCLATLPAQMHLAKRHWRERRAETRE